MKNTMTLYKGFIIERDETIDTELYYIRREDGTKFGSPAASVDSIAGSLDTVKEHIDRITKDAKAHRDVMWYKVMLGREEVAQFGTEAEAKDHANNLNDAYGCTGYRVERMTWAEIREQELDLKGRENWDQDDWDAYYYIEECKAEDARDAEYIGCYAAFLGR